MMLDKGCDSKKLIGYIESCGAEAVIPPRSNLKDQREFDHCLATAAGIDLSSALSDLNAPPSRRR